MKHIFHTIQHTARAATVLLLALLAAQTAGAQEDIRQVSNALNLVEAFNDPTVSVVNVTDNITVVGGLEPVNGNRNLTINLNGNTISGDYLSFNVEPDGSLTINGGGSVGNIISGYAYLPAIDNLGTVTLSHVNITTNYDFAIGGEGTLNIGENVSFNGWTERPFSNPSVNITGNYRSNVVATVTVGGQTHYFENSDAALTYIVSHPDNDHFSLSGTTYTIHTATGWDAFCYLLENGETFSGKTVELANDITVTRMAGLEGHEFQGTFDGNKKTLTVSISSSDGNAAPFREIMGATIRNIKVSGTVSGHKHSAGLVSYARGADSSVENTIENCLVATDVSTIVDTDGDCYLGGIVGHGLKSKLTIRGCAFTGSLTSPHNYTGGLQGWSDGNTLILENDIFAASSVNAANVGFHPIAFHVNNATTTATVTNVYYTVAPTCTTASRIAAAGKQARAVTAGTDVTVAHAGVATHYATSGITAYKATGASADSHPFIAGLLYNNNVVDVLYAGIDDVVSLTLSNTATGAPDGYQYSYTTNAGTLSGSTLTMPDQDVTVSVNTEVLTAIPWSGDGTEGSPYIIEYPSQLDLLAYRVNGTHGETANDYYNTYFKLNNDIKYTPTTDWDDAECEQENNYEAIGGYYDGIFRQFRGHFDGNNKTISGIRIYKNGTGNVNSYQGIFGQTGTGADIHDLTLADARITGYHYTGGIVGDNYGTVTGCHVADDVAVCAEQSYAWFHGGIAGYTDGTIELCTSAANLTTADADNSQYYGGIAGRNIGGTLSDNLAIGATVPAAADNTYGAITGENDGGTLHRNYYTACKVADTENATGVGCGNIGNDDDGYTTADVTANNGAVSIHTLTLADGITTTTAATVTIGTTGYYAQGTAIALSYSGDVPLGYQYAGFTASAGTLDGSTLTMPDQDVTVSPAFRSTHAAVPVSYVDAGGTTLTHDAVALDGTESNLGTDDEETWYFVGLPTVASDHMLRLHGDVNLILADGCTMNVTSSNADGIDVFGTLTIYGQTDGTGTLNATGGDYRHGIYTNSGTITISGGRVTATGFLAGITTNSGTITISGGTVTATGDTAGILTDGGTITISGGRVTATSDNGAGILSYSGTITLGCTTASDFIYVSSYVVGSKDRLNIADGQRLYDQNGIFYSGNGVTIHADKTLRLYGIDLAAREAPDGNYWTTYYNSATGFTIDDDEHACAYTATYGAGQLTLHKLGKEIPAGTAVIIVADNDEVSMTAADLDAYTGANDLHGVDVDTDVADITSALGTGTLYVLGMTTIDDEQHFGFHRYTGTDMAAHKAFVHVAGSPSQSPARSLTMVFDDATAIQGLTPAAAPQSPAADHWFTLDGRRLQAKPTAPGIYVNNGRKVVIK